jgi:hypothetical protein
MAVTIDEVMQELEDNIGFEQQGSVSMANAFIQAANLYLILTPQSQSDQGSSMSISVSAIENMLKRAYSYVTANRTSSGSVRHLTVSENFR